MPRMVSSTGRGHFRFPASAGSASTDTSGWTTFTATAPSGEGDTFSGAGTRIVYVSSSTGSDSNAGTLAAPYATVEKGLAALRAGKPDWCLLKKGDTWTNPQMNLTNGGLSGSGFATTFTGAPRLIGSYPATAGSRPICRWNGTGFTNNWTPNTAGGSGTDGYYTAIVGIEFYAYTRDPSNGSFSTTDRDRTDVSLTNLEWPSPYFLFEDCKWSYGVNNAVVDAGVHAPSGPAFGTVIFNRCVSAFAYNTGGTHGGQGAYIQYVNDLNVVECVFDHNGWLNDNGSTSTATPDQFRHNLYIGADDIDDGSTWAVRIQTITAVRGNIFARASANGLQCRPGGTVTGNFFTNNPIAWFTSTPNLPSTNQVQQSSTATYNVAVNLTDIDSSDRRGQGGHINGGDNSTMSNNIVAHNLSGAPSLSSFGFKVGGNTKSSANNTTVTSNIAYDLSVTLTTNSSTDLYFNQDTNSSGTSWGGTFPGSNTQLASGGGYLDSTRDAASYNASIGGTGTLAAYMTECRLQSKDNWRDAYTARAVVNYIRAGFNLGNIP